MTRIVAQAERPPEVYAYTTEATEAMAVTLKDFEDGAELLSQNATLASFVQNLAKSFLGAGEAKWWDAATAVSLGEIIAGNKVHGQTHEKRVGPRREDAPDVVR